MFYLYFFKKVDSRNSISVPSTGAVGGGKNRLEPLPRDWV